MQRILLCFLTAVFMAAPLAAAPANDSDPEIIKPKGEKRNFTGVYPDHVKTIAVITPGSYPNPKSLKSGVALLRKAGYKVKIYPNVLRRPDGVEKNRYLSCPVEFRVKDFEAAWRDMENDFIICVRGGKGTEDLVDKVNWASLPRRPELYVMGYSDVTMLLCALSGKGYGRPIAGPNVSSHPGLDPAMIPEIKKMFHGEELTPVKLKTLVPGDCSGKALAGLLARLALVSSKNYGLQTKGKILFIESVKVDAETAREIMSTFCECVVAPAYDDGVLDIFNDGETFKLNKHIRIVQCGDIAKLPKYVGDDEDMSNYTIKVLADGSVVLAAPLLTSLHDVSELRPAEAENKACGYQKSTVAATPEQLEDLLFAWYVNINVRSNGVVIAKNGQTLSVGTGEQDRVGAIEQAIIKFKDKYEGEGTLQGAVMASDGFFPFADGVERAAEAGITAIISPSGSLKDADVIKRANELGVALYHAPERIFSHH